RRMLALLDARYREPEALRRLRDAVAAEDGPQILPLQPTLHRPRRRAGPWRRVAALAAMLLLTVGLAALLRPRGEDGAALAVVWASPDARWEPRGAGTIDLSAGELWLRRGPDGAEKAAVVVRTPAGVAS